MSIARNRFTTFKRIDRFKESERLEKVEFESFEMDFAMKSINLEEQEFTNMCKSLSSQQYTTMEDLYYRYKNGENILADFEFGNILPYDNINRLKNIIDFNLSGQTFKIHEVYKFSYKQNNKIRFYVKNDNGNLMVVLIDLFHLALPSKHECKTKKEMQREVYLKNKKNKININEIKKYYKIKMS